MEHEQAYPHLFSPGKIGSLTIPNRIVQLPMGTGLMVLGKVSDDEIAFQEERASSGVGLLITGAGAIHETALWPVRIKVEAWDESGIEGLRRRVEAVQRHGTRIFGQILHLGRETPGGMTDYAPMAPSPIASPRNADLPHEMNRAEIAMIVEAFGRSAANFHSAGYDGLEVSAGHGYLIAQFLSPASNRRNDAYRGDTLDGRLRFLREIVEEIRARCGDDFPLGVRLSADEQVAGGLALDDTLEIADALQAVAPVDYFSVTTGMRGGYVKDSSWNEGFALGLSEAVKQVVDVPVIVAGRIRQPDLAERALAASQADFVGIGRALIADPEWALKARDGRLTEIRPCVGIVQDCRRPEGVIACAVNARAGREWSWGPSRAAGAAKRVVVVGAGPGGMETARVAAAAGHDVVLLERSEQSGGQLRIAAAGPTREELLDFVFYLERELRRLDVDIHYQTEATEESVLAERPDLVVIAAGATPLPPDFPFDSGAHVVTAWDLLAGRVAQVPERAVVLDDATGFWHGISAAEFLAERGVKVQLLSPGRAVGQAIPHESVARAHQRLYANGVVLRPLVDVRSVSGTTVSIMNSVSGEQLDSVQAELVVVRTRQRVNDELTRALDGRVPALASVGDCVAPRRLSHAVLDASLVLRRFDAGQLSKTSVVPF
jgi:2,4-dienoyl-CoA reductase-like NADH-dependent reductase (Old Yellow Enzyme family)